MSNKSYLSVYAKSFSWAGFFLPKKTLEKCSALYDFCRTVDNIADDDGDLNIKKNETNLKLHLNLFFKTKILNLNTDEK